MLSVEQCKESISDRYIQDFKKELGFFDKILVAPIFSKMKDILKSDKKIDVENLKDLEDLGFWRKVLGIKIGDKQLFDNLVNKTFIFLKEKQEKIIQAQTEGKLDVLLDVVINGKLDNLDQNINHSGESEQNNSEQNQTGEQTSQKSEGGESEQNNSQQGQTGEQASQQKEGGESEQDNSQQNQTGEQVSQQKEGGNSEQNEGNKEGLNLKNHAVEIGVGTGTASALTYRKGIQEAEKKLGLTPKEIPTEFNAKRTKEMLEELAKQMKNKSENVKMNRIQKFTYKKSIKAFEKAAESLDDNTAMAFKDRQKLGSKMPPDFLRQINIDKNVLNMIDALPEKELQMIIGKSEKEIVEILGQKGIKISEEFARGLKIAENIQEVKQLTNIVRNGRKLSNFVKGIKGMGVITFLLMGLDVRYYFDTGKEADLVKKINKIRGEVKQDEATAQLIIGLGGVLLEALALAGVCAATGSVGGPIGTGVGICVGVIITAASLMTSSYHEKKEFYAQNRYDFINQKRTEIKQSIVQLFESDRLDMHEGMKKSIKNDRGPKSEIDTMEDAWEALIYQEEIMEGGFESLQGYYNSGESEGEYKKNLSEEEKKQYEEEKKKMEDIIKIRMEYIKQYVKEDKKSKEYNEMKKALSDNKGIEYVEQLLADSKVYAYLKSDNENAYIQNYKEMDVNGYKEAYKQKLSQEYNQEFIMFEKLRKENPLLLQEICEGTLASKGVIEGSFDNEESSSCYSEQEKAKLKRNIDFITKYNEYLNLGKPIEKQTSTGTSFSSGEYGYIEQILLDLNSINKRPVWDKESTKNYLSSFEFNDMIENIDSQVSNSVFQNILYSIAREIHGYTGKNDKLELVRFFTCDGDSTGVYMDGEWRIKYVSGRLGTKDGTVDDPDKLTKNQVLKMFENIDLDSTIEVADEKLTKEFRKRVKSIIEREYSYREKKKDYEKQVVDFIKTNNNGENGYVEIPENLVINAKKAGIGDVNKFLFRVENGYIYALSRGDMTKTVLHFDDSNIKIKYESFNPLRNELSQQEKKLINCVDSMETKLNKLRSKQGQFLFWTQHEDDLDIPVELERIISQKSIEWNNLKKSILYMEPKTAHDYLLNKSQEYFNFFNGMYLGILNRVTNMNHIAGINSNDMNNSTDFLYATQLIGVDIAYVKDGKIEINKSVSEAIKKHLPDLFNSYKDPTTGKTVKELLMDEDENKQKIGQELAKKIYELCLEQAVLTFDDKGAVSKILTLDFSDNDLKKVKEKMKNGLKGVGFQQAYNEFVDKSLKFEYTTSIRTVEQAEVDTHKKIDDITQNIINTMKNVDRANERKNPEFVPDKDQKKEGKITGEFSSRGYSEKITIDMDGSKNLKSITIDGLMTTFSNLEEGFRTVNLINFIHHNAKKHPRGESAEGRMWGSYGLYHWSNGGDLERDVTNNMSDFDILENDYLEKKYPKIHKNKDFLNYINKFL